MRSVISHLKLIQIEKWNCLRFAVEVSNGQSPLNSCPTHEQTPMYFLHGWPKSYKVPLKPEPIIAIRHSPDFALIAVVTASTVYIWSGDQVRTTSSHCQAFKLALLPGIVV